MKLVTLFSLKGAPGVTTLACLLGSAWSGTRPVVVVEADPAGGDLAARFGLSARVGWASLASSTRRSGSIPALGPHLQTLPGGLPVLVAARGEERRSPDADEGAVVRADAGDAPDGGSGLTIVDLGRVGSGDDVSERWLAISDVALLVVRGDASSSVQVRDRREALADICQDRLGAVVVGGDYSVGELEEFTGIPTVTDIPFDTSAADVANGGHGSARRLGRSPLWAAVIRMAATLDARVDGGPVLPDHLEQYDEARDDPRDVARDEAPGSLVGESFPFRRRPLRHLVSRKGPDARLRSAPDLADEDDRWADA